MSIGALALLSLLPIMSVAVFLVLLRWPASRAMPIAYAVAFVLAWLVWQVPPTKILAASVNGLIVAATLIFIIFGAILLLNTLRQSGAMYAIREGFSDISPDRSFAAGFQIRKFALFAALAMTIPYVVVAAAFGSSLRTLPPASAAVVGLVGKEGAVIRKTLLPFLYYALVTGSIGYGIVTGGIFNAGFIVVAMIAALMIALIVRYNRRTA